MTSATLSGSCGYDGQTKAFCGLEAVFLRSSEGTRPIPTTITLLIPAFFIWSAGTDMSSLDFPVSKTTKIYKCFTKMLVSFATIAIRIHNTTTILNTN